MNSISESQERRTAMKLSQTEMQPLVKRRFENTEMEDERFVSFNKRPNSMGMTCLTVLPNPLDEPSPLGLRLKKSPSLLELIQAKLSKLSTPPVGYLGRSINKVPKASSVSSDRLKASNFYATLLRIGTWEYKSKHEGDLVAKCYFGKHKLVWEVLDGGLKNKIEIQWSDIVALKRTNKDNDRESLSIVLARQPIFFREIDPQPRKRTIWEATTDFTGGQASIHRQHFLECQRGSMGKHIEKIIQCDPHMMLLCRQNLDLNEEGSSSISSSQDTASGSGVRSLTLKDDVDSMGRHSGSYSHEALSPNTAMEMHAAGDTSNNKFEQLKVLSNWDSTMVPGMHPSKSMSDLVIHVEGRISEQGTPINPTLTSKEWQSRKILDEINRSLFTDVKNLPEPDEKSLLSRVNSLCRLLQNDDDNPTFECEDKPNKSFGALLSDELLANEKKAENDGWPNMSREDSAGDLLLNLPRVTSLPQFLFK